MAAHTLVSSVVKQKECGSYIQPGRNRINMWYNDERKKVHPIERKPVTEEAEHRSRSDAKMLCCRIKRKKSNMVLSVPQGLGSWIRMETGRSNIRYVRNAQ